MDIRITTASRALTGKLNESSAARDFAAMLPLTIELSDFHGTEKIADLPGRLRAEGSPDAAAAKAGDIAYYAPWGNFALFYRDLPRSAGLVILGHIDGTLDPILAANDGLVVTIEAAGSGQSPSTSERTHS